MAFHSEQLQHLFQSHIPSIVENPTAYTDSVALDLGLRAVDEFMQAQGKLLTRHGTYALELEAVFSEQEYQLVTKTCSDRAIVLKLFLAAEVEDRLQSALSFEQQRKLAEVFAQLGLAFSRCGWYAHSQHCSAVGARYYGQLRMFSLEDRCWYQQRKSAMRAAPWFERFTLFPLYVFAGFGFKPYRLVWCALLLIGLFAGLYVWLEPPWTWTEAVLVSSFTYLAAFGFADMEAASAVTRWLLTAQGFIALVLNATLFALLVKKWFR